MGSVVDVGQAAASIKLNAVLTTAAFGQFSPHAGSGYLVGITTKSTGSTGAPVFGVYWSAGGSGSWARLASHSADQWTPHQEWWLCTTPTAPGLSTVTIMGDANTDLICFALIREITGHDPLNPLGKTASDGSTATTLSITPDHDGSLLMLLAHDYMETWTPTPNAASLNVDNYSDNGEIAYALKNSAPTVALTPVVLGVTNTATGNEQLAIEIVAAPGPSSGPNNAGAAAALAGGTGTWATTGNAVGGDDGTYAVWTRP